MGASSSGIDKDEVNVEVLPYSIFKIRCRVKKKFSNDPDVDVKRKFLSGEKHILFPRVQ